MKKILTILPIIIILAACSNNTSEEKIDSKIETTASEDAHLTVIIDVASSTISEILESEGVGRNMMIIDPKADKPYIEIIRVDGLELPDVETKEIQERIKDTVLSKTDVNFNVTLRSQTKEEIRDTNWHPIFDALIKEMESEFEEYRGFGYSFSPEPLQIIIKTDMKDNKSTGKIEEIEQYANKIIEKKIQELSVEKIPYKIIIRGIGDEDIN